MRKITFIGGGGVRTPLVSHGLAQAQPLLNIGELTLYDVAQARTETMARLGREIVRKLDGGFEIRTATRLEEACQGADFVLNSIRVPLASIVANGHSPARRARQDNSNSFLIASSRAALQKVRGTRKSSMALASFEC